MSIVQFTHLFLKSKKIVLVCVWGFQLKLLFTPTNQYCRIAVYRLLDLVDLSITLWWLGGRVIGTAPPTSRLGRCSLVS